jgi:hypothetical protein
MSPTGTSHSNGQMGLSLSFIKGEKEPNEFLNVLQKFFGLLPLENIFRYL